MGGNATVAKIRTVFGSALTAADYHEMTNRQSVAELCEYLKGLKRFSEVLYDVEPATVHRGYLEQLIRKESFLTYRRLVKFQQLDRGEFYKFYIKKAETVQLISFLHMYEAGLNEEYLASVPGYMTEYSRLKLFDLAACHSFDEILRVLRRTEYYKPLKRIMPKDGGEPELAAAERALRVHYYKRVLEAAKRELSEDEYKEIARLIGTDADLINYTNAYRMKKYFSFDAGQIEKRSLPFSRIGLSKMRELYSCEETEDMELLMDKTVYRNDAADQTIESRNAKARLTAVRHVIEMTSSSAAALLAYMMICDIEAANITHIIEGIRYKADLSEIEAQLAV
ncbi:MAG: V-type ATPase subunit [Ruminococcus sp.]|nr:V-type ATPase subunit [Ruminococcus sp.]